MFNKSISIPSALSPPSKAESFSIDTMPSQGSLYDKLYKIPENSSDKLHPKKNETQPYAEYVEEGLWKSRVTFQKDHSFSVCLSKLRAQSSEHSGKPMKSLDSICEEELQRRFPDFCIIQGVKASFKNNFPILAKWVMGKIKFYRELTQKEIDQFKKQISFSACDRDDIICSPRIENQELRNALNLKDDSLLETEHLFAKNSPLNGKVFDRDGKIIHLSQGIACTSDRTVENTGNLRLIQTKRNESICYAGRPDTECKALEQASLIFFNELKTNKKGITPTKDALGNVTYQLDYVVNSLLDAPWVWNFESTLTAFPEREYLERELKSLDNLRKKGLITLEDPHFPGVKYQVKFNPILFSRSLDAFNRLEKWLPPFVTGVSRAQEISEMGFSLLDSLALQKLSELNFRLLAEQSTLLKAQLEDKIKKINSTLQILQRHQNDHSLLPAEELLTRDYLCKLLDLPQVFHCKSSLDRTSIPVALSSTLQQWIELKLPLYPNSQESCLGTSGNICELIKDCRFKELFVCNWMAGHQITRYTCNRKGTVAGEKLKTKILGFTLHHGVLQNP